MTITIQEIKDRTDEVGECWVWKKAITSGYPQIKVQGRACKLVRRLVVELDGRPELAAAAGKCDDAAEFVIKESHATNQARWSESPH